MAPVLDSGLPLSLTLKRTQITLRITVEEVKSSLASVTVAAPRSTALGAVGLPDVWCCARFKLFLWMFDVLTILAFSRFSVFTDGHSDVADFILSPLPGG